MLAEPPAGPARRPRASGQRASPRPAGPVIASPRRPGKRPLRTSSAKAATASVAMRPSVGVLTHELRRRLARSPRPEQVVEDQHLPVAGRPGPDADRRHVERLGRPPRPPRRAPPRSRSRSTRPPRAPSPRRAAPSAASTLLPCTRKPPMASTDCGVRPRWPITGISARMIASTHRQAGPPALELDRLGARPGSAWPRCAPPRRCERW